RAAWRALSGSHPRACRTYTAFSVVAPAATPAASVQRMSAEILKAMKSPGLKEKLESAGYIPVFDTPEDYATSLRKKRLLWAEVIRRSNIVAEWKPIAPNAAPAP